MYGGRLIQAYIVPNIRKSADLYNLCNRHNRFLTMKFPEGRVRKVASKMRIVEIRLGSDHGKYGRCNR